MRRGIGRSVWFAAVLLCALALPASAQQSDTQDQVHIPVLRKRPSANDTSQPPAAQPQPTAQPQTQSSPDDDPNRPVLKRRPPASDTGQQSAPPPPAQNAPAPPVQAGPAAQGPGSTNPQSPPGRHAAVMRHGAEAMGFSQQTTTHHFALTRSGGVIRVTVNDPGDTDGAGRISVHLRQVAAQFARGDFSAPERTHGVKPPGAAVMQQLRNKIIYTAHAIQDGAELIISSQDRKAIDAIHQFLQFQIQDHGTGDSAAVR